MGTRYWLPCDCGQRVAVEGKQAGLTVTCACGRSLGVPTIRGLSQLESIGEPSAPARRSWGPRQGMILLGSVIALPCLLMATAGFFYTPPEHPITYVDREGIRKQIDGMSPADLITMWEGAQNDFDTAAAPQLQQYADWVANFRAWTWAYVAGTAVGLAICVGGLLTRPAPGGG